MQATNKNAAGNKKAQREARKAQKAAAAAEAQKAADAASAEAQAAENATPSLAAIVSPVEAQQAPAAEPAAPATPPAAQTAAPVKIRGPQKKILLFLAATGAAKTRKEIAFGARVDYPYCTSHLGSENDSIRIKNDSKIYPSLKSLGFVSSRARQGDGGIEYLLTDAGREFLAALQAPPQTVATPVAEVVATAEGAKS